MAKKSAGAIGGASSTSPKSEKPSSLLDTRVVYCGNNLEQLANLPDACVDYKSTNMAALWAFSEKENRSPSP